MTTETKIIIGVVIATVIILGGGIWFLNIQGAKDQAKLNQPLIGEAIASQGANHVPESTKEEYSTNPPTSGPHYANSQPAGIYDKPIPDGNLIHSMEHGAVILWYKPSSGTDNQVTEGTESAKTNGLSEQDIDRLKQIFGSVSVSKKIMIPRDSLDVPIALTSWGRLLKLQTIDEDRIKTFMETNEDRGPEKAPL
ncbi:hypothetical protein A2778_05520 [Candidatus Daviesbacteria bacterium RIFCSPHIGHO2_01_FULL_40_24]|uniref:DUF3105 domain-containing protein n=1 Tax=Candidatus Daviesbacteria bacterium GW2011_GWC2_40_12 TaxID=1618431 RepID=A0A0G0QZD5_9BACT|nr:MAG: hypothetical protein UT45_C0001G0103 [Candidatus Daviesbacteria bacterium GW2011_GWA2_39_33]KKR42806.1 MAG: hypothetical protein UT77_C0001G0257 [Candidatus Daviesbacteria bacterium GW2011_GWC2_40_12]OGE21615.1 MAG: hypothetical protein A2778_05520 [Candidatus Daviesbacteria bacterium RIFCSPHIGHO2_01_FULL_40_24]OGE30012.1 MAG: hypothetical protein A3C29_01225 [Candidatus Daviesbacteria bacterium RIFCSPHIGHO2_02_FULL_40_16]OGE43553.1 MAG: hypothetical protein A3A53_02890 [Candidatus Davi